MSTRITLKLIKTFVKKCRTIAIMKKYVITKFLLQLYFENANENNVYYY